jgi:hypothetical protein
LTGEVQDVLRPAACGLTPPGSYWRRSRHPEASRPKADPPACGGYPRRRSYAS